MRDKKNNNQDDLEAALINPIVSEDWYRTIELKEEVNQGTCSAFLNAINKFLVEDPNDMITILISSNGGYIEEAFCMYDILRHARKTCIIRTICYGRAYSAAAFILACGTKGYRYAYPSCSAMIHGIQLEGFISGHVSSTTVPMIQKVMDDYKRLIDYFAYELLKGIDKNGKEVSAKKKAIQEMGDNLALAMSQDTYMNSKQMRELKLVDHVGIPELLLKAVPEESEDGSEEFEEEDSESEDNNDPWNLITLENEQGDEDE